MLTDANLLQASETFWEEQYFRQLTHRCSLYCYAFSSVAKQAIFYAVAFLAMHLLNLISTARYYISGDWNDVFDYIAYGVLFTSPGTLNLMVFLRTRIEMATPEGRFLRRFFCCSCALFGYNVTSDLIHLQAPTEQAPTNTADPSNSETKHDFRDYDFIHGVRIDI